MPLSYNYTAALNALFARFAPAALKDFRQSWGWGERIFDRNSKGGLPKFYGDSKGGYAIFTGTFPKKYTPLTGFPQSWKVRESHGKICGQRKSLKSHGKSKKVMEKCKFYPNSHSKSSHRYSSSHNCPVMKSRKFKVGKWSWKITNFTLISIQNVVTDVIVSKIFQKYTCKTSP